MNIRVVARSGHYLVFNATRRHGPQLNIPVKFQQSMSISSVFLPLRRAIAQSMLTRPPHTTILVYQLRGSLTGFPVCNQRTIHCKFVGTYLLPTMADIHPIIVYFSMTNTEM